MKTRRKSAEHPAEPSSTCHDDVPYRQNQHGLSQHDLSQAILWQNRMASCALVSIVAHEQMQIPGGDGYSGTLWNFRLNKAGFACRSCNTVLSMWTMRHDEADHLFLLFHVSAIINHKQHRKMPQGRFHVVSCSCCSAHCFNVVSLTWKRLRTAPAYLCIYIAEFCFVGPHRFASNNRGSRTSLVSLVPAQLADWIGWGDEHLVSGRFIYCALYTPPHVFLVSFILEYTSMLLTQRPEPVLTSDNM